MGKQTKQHEAEDQGQNPAEIHMDGHFHEQLSTGLFEYDAPYWTEIYMSSKI
jgi:hypothetical protein